MADFRTAVSLTVRNEGGFTDNPNDRGGATNFGITQKDMPGRDIKSITVDDAVTYYSEHYWKALFTEIENQAVANKLFDMGVLFGVGEAVYLLQRALNFSPFHWSRVFDDYTLLAVNQNPPSLLTDYKTHLRLHATNIANATPTNKVFLTGWLRRIDS